MTDVPGTGIPARRTLVTVVRAVDTSSASAVADHLATDLRVFENEECTIMVTGSAVVVVVATDAGLEYLVDAVNTVLMDVDLVGLIDDRDDDGWQHWMDGTGQLAGVLGDDRQAWETFAVLLPGSTDSLERLARAAVRVNAEVDAPTAGPVADRPVRMLGVRRSSSGARGAGF